MGKSANKKIIEAMALMVAFCTASPAALADQSSSSIVLPEAAESSAAASPTAINSSPAQASPTALAGQPAASPGASQPPAKSGKARIANWPICIAGFACGTIVGIPICFARKMPDEFHNLAHGFVGSITTKESKALLIPAGIAWLPFSATAALIEAPAYAWKNAYMAEKPFSKEQFSLGEMDAPDKKHTPDPD